MRTVQALFVLLLVVMLFTNVGEAGIPSGVGCGLCWHLYRQHWRWAVANGAHAFVPWGPPVHGLGLTAEYFMCKAICLAAVVSPV